ncbi:MAG TPA: heat-inducible transcriptional repressor HrcA [Thermoanaerobaculia bacterium]|nr:heat-inducible transcriptional repressor HrcA [Thermoanaerobaculia bacterium]
MTSEFKGLDGRSREVLASVIVAYIESAAPVSSRQLTKGGKFGLSSASLRNAMADLEDLGFLMHPHVSAGRIPTDLGYRAFVSELMTTRLPSVEERARIVEELAPEPFETDRFFQATSRVLARLTGEVGVVAAPASARFVLDSVHFTRLTERKILVAEVSDAGLVESRLIETRDDYEQLELDTISRRLTVDYAGRTLDEIRAHLLDALAEEKSRMDRALARALELGRRAFAEGRPENDAVFVDGTESLLEKPEFRGDVEALRRMFRAFEEKARLVSLLTDCLSWEGARVVIGSDSAFTGETQAAVVTAPYRKGGRVLGALGVVGPRRMEYERVVPLVEELGRYVSHRLTEGAA